jgi:transcriptional regulator
MHPNIEFHWNDRAGHEAMIAQIGFGMIFATTPDGPRVAHVPILSTGDGAIQFHLAKGNALTKHLAGMDALCVVNGPDSYISPDFYGLEDQVPTWNYVALELEGRVRQMDHDGLVAFLDEASAHHEEQLAPKEPWTRDMMDPKRFDGLVKSVVGFELEVKAWRATAKLNQNKPADAREKVAAALDERGRRAMAHVIRELGER